MESRVQIQTGSGITLFRAGEYFQLWTQEEAGKLLLASAFYAANNCLLFDWNLTMENARALRALLPSEYTTPFSNDQFDTILNSVRKEFPEAIPAFPIDARPEPDQILSIPGHHVERYEFEPQDDGDLPNAPALIEVNPATAKTKKAEYEKMLRFRKLVEKTIRPEPDVR